MNNEFCALSAKLSAMHSGHLTFADYNALLEKHSVNEICSYLKKTYYEQFISDLNDASIHRGMLEKRIDRKLENEYVKLYKFVGLNERKLIRFLLLQNEISVLNTVLRRVLSHEETYSNGYEIVKSNFFSEHSDIDAELLQHSKTVSDICAACKNSVLYPVLKHADSMNADYPAISMMLTRFYFKALWAAASKFIQKNQQPEFKKFLGTQIDYLNIMWIYRCKRYFKTPKELIYTYLIPVYYRLSKDDISSLVEAETKDEYERLILNGRYADILKSADGEFYIERNYNRICFENAKKAYKLQSGTFTEVYAFFGLLMTERENIKTIIEGIRYGISPDIIRKNICINR